MYVSIITIITSYHSFLKVILHTTLQKTKTEANVISLHCSFTSRAHKIELQIEFLFKLV